MQKTQKIAENPPAILPDPEAFRAWLRGALSDLGLKATSYGPSIGLGKNTINHFLQGGSRDLRLGTAAALFEGLHDRAEKDEKALAALEGVFHG